jgi:hypothetical protein
MLLALDECQGLQEATNCGPEYLANKIRLGQWTPGELLEVLRWGLIGGGMGAEKADQLVVRTFRQQEDGRRNFLMQFKAPALECLLYSLHGPADDPVGEDLPVGPTPEDEKTDAGSLAPSTGSAQ